MKEDLSIIAGILSTGVLLYLLWFIRAGMKRLKNPVEGRPKKAPVLEPQNRPRPTNPIVIGLSGKMGSGKSATAEALRLLLPSAIVVSFADILKEEASRRFSFPLEWCYSNKNGYLPLTPERKDKGMPHTMTVRGLLQWFGTDMVRHSDPEYWVEAMRKKLRTTYADYIIIDDVRFPNEAEFVKELGGVLIRLEKADDYNGPALTAPFKHPSETSLDWYKAWNMVFHPSKSSFGVDYNVVNAVLGYLGE